MIRVRSAVASATMLLACAALVLVGCGGCGRKPQVVAEVTKRDGDVERDTASTVKQWQPATDGAKLAMGDGVKTGPSSDAVVRVTGGGTIALQSNTTLRFLETAPGAAEPGIDVETGEATIESEDRAVTMRTKMGIAHVEAGGKLRVTAAPGGATRIEVTVGVARLETDDGGLTLSPGRSFEVAVGGAIVEREIEDAATAVSARPSDAAVEPSGGRITLDVHGAGVRAQAHGATTWRALTEGSGSVAEGDALEVPNGASVDVRRGDVHARLVGRGQAVMGDAKGPLLRATGGKIELDATTEDVLIDVPGGTIAARVGAGDARSLVDVDVSANGTKVSVRRGRGEARGSGAAETVRPGEEATVNPRGAVAVSGRGPERADFTVKAGDSFTVRDPRPPTAVGFDFSSVCPGAAVVSRDEHERVRGDGHATLSLGPGRHEYAVRCVGPDGMEEKPAATGSVTIIADAARAELARLPPSTIVDTDGRRYTVLYQNLLPVVVARWPDAAPASGYVLHLDSQSIKTATARHSLPAGSVGEGTHTLSFETSDGAKRSAETTLFLRFDNAAPTASVREPADGSFHPGDAVRVAGVVVEGWTVSVNGQAVPLDEQKRFSSNATVPPAENALVLRMSNAKRGTVYYVRHAGANR